MRRVKLVTVASWNLTGRPDHFLVLEHRGVVTVRFPDSFAPSTRTFASMEAALHTLGGIVPWACWSAATQDSLLAHTNGRII